MQMNNSPLLILSKDTKKYYIALSERQIKGILSHPSLWTHNWQEFHQLLMLYGFQEEQLANFDISHELSNAYIDWDNATCHQFMGDHVFDGFGISLLSLDLKGRVYYGDDFPESLRDINMFLENLRLGNIANYIESTAHMKDGTRKDIKVFFDLSNFCSVATFFIEQNRKVEENPVLMSDFHLYTDIDINNVKSIIFHHFPLSPKSWVNHISECNQIDIIQITRIK